MPHRRALVVAPLYSSSSDFPPLPGAIELVRRVRPVLAEHGGYDVRVVNGAVDKARMRRELATFFDSDGELLLYFYGHGCVRQSGAGVFATSDARPFDEGVDMSEVAGQAGASRAREVVMIVDCCHAEACLHPVGGGVLATVAKLPTAQAGRAFLASSREHQAGWEAATDQARLLGAFSSTVLDGLEGAAATRFAAGAVGAMLLGQYVLDEFLRWGQDPVIEVKAQGGLACTIVSGFAQPAAAPPEPARIYGAPFRPSAMFVGRDAEIDHLRTLLVGGDRPIAVSAAVEGLGGVGKTELVLQLTQQPDIQARYRSIVWLDAAGPLVPQWEKLGRDLGLSQAADDPARLIGAVAAALGDCLYIVDNAERWDAVSGLVPDGRPMLVTTRSQGFGGNAFVHTSLEVLDDRSARDLLVRMVPGLAGDPWLAKLVETLQGHALALELAGWHINHLGGTARDYLERLARHDEDLALAVDATAYGRTVDACLALTWDSLAQPASRTLWRRASLFAPVSAHRDLLHVSLRGTRRSRRLAEDPSMRDLIFDDPADFAAAYAELRSVHVLGRVEGDGMRWAVHRLVRDFGRLRLRRFESTVHTLAIADWLRDPHLPLGPEAPHLVAAVLEAARNAAEMAEFNSDRHLAREIFVRSSDQPRSAFDPGVILLYLREELRDPQALRLMVEGLVDVNEDVRVQAIRMINRVGPTPEVLEGLAASLSDPEPRVRENALSTLVNHSTDRTVDLIAEVARRADHRAGRHMATALFRIGSDHARRVLRELALEPSRPVAGAAGLLVLATDRNDIVHELLIRRIGETAGMDRDTLFREWLSLLPRGREPVTWRWMPTDFLIWCLQSRLWLVPGRRVALALGAQRATAAVPALLGALCDGSERAAAAEALGLIGDPSALDELDTVAESDSHDEVRRAARRAAARIRRTEDAGA